MYRVKCRNIAVLFIDIHQLGIQFHMIASAIELGNVGVSFDVIFKLCEVLEITPKQLFDFRE